MQTYFFIVLPTVLALENVALNKPTQQVSDSLSFPGPADRAVDGNTDGNLYHGSCTNTNEQNLTIQTWWKVDLMGFYKVSGVEIFTRTDCCSSRLKQFEVRVSLVNPTTFPSNEGQLCFHRTDEVSASGLYINCTQPIIGRYVSLFKPDYDILSICELRVFADRAVSESGCLQRSTQPTSADNSVRTCPYSVVMDNFQVVGNVSKSFEAVSALTCAVRCAQTDNCFAFNFLESSVTCELVLSLNEFVPFTESNLIQQTGWRVFALSLPFTEIVSLQEVLEVVIVDDP